MNVAVVGAAGYAGGELLRLLLSAPRGARVRRHQPEPRRASRSPTHTRRWRTLTDARFSGADAGRGRAGSGRRLSLPRARRVLPGRRRGVRRRPRAGRGPRRRLPGRATAALYERYYGPHPAPELLPRFCYGLADVARRRRSAARGAIAAPGCFATAAQLALYPLARAGLDVAPSLFAVTGSSGAGVQPKPTTHHPMRAHNLFAYSVLGHRHEAEVLQRWRRVDRAARCDRAAHDALGAVRARDLSHAPRVSAATGTRSAPAIRASRRRWFREAYAGRPFVRVLDAPPELTHAVGTNYALIHAAESDDGTEMQVSVAIDNLVKGAGGQAIQAMNLALGLEETAGLRGGGMFPC